MIEEAEMSITNMAMEKHGQYAGDETLLVRFEPRVVQNQSKTEQEGRPIFDTVDYIEIRFPGNKLSVIHEPVTPEYKKRFPEHWKRYVARESQEVVDGTPLEEWPGINRSQVEELRFLNIRSIEQLVTLSDGHAGKIMGIQTLKTKAKAYLEASKLQGEANALLAANQRIKEQEELNAKMASRLEALESLLTEKSEPKRRGRPPKEEMTDECII